MALKQQGIARTLYDDTNLHALINLCSRRLQKPFEYRDIQFLRLYLQYCLLQHHAGVTPEFNPLQQRWAQSCAEYPLAEEIGPPLATPRHAECAAGRIAVYGVVVFNAPYPRPRAR